MADDIARLGELLDDLVAGGVDERADANEMAALWAKVKAALADDVDSFDSFRDGEEWGEEKLEEFAGIDHMEQLRRLVKRSAAKAAAGPKHIAPETEEKPQ